MDSTHVFIKWINRVVLSIFIILVILGFSFDDEILIYAMFYTMFIGAIQFISGLILSFKKYDKLINKRIRIYVLSAIFYFVIMMFFSNFYNDLSFTGEDSIAMILILIPVLLLIYFTYLSETIK